MAGQGYNSKRKRSLNAAFNFEKVITKGHRGADRLDNVCGIT